ncbi:hypothetical protein [Nonomuraea lactucae]|uniref:hypothetical protein n=1 Tax=Nonomuraea lactucae TaxID=2249762 RepID=UPI000DE208E8|nr:hypothetical protein [Nonomuraea lactucae]
MSYLKGFGRFWYDFIIGDDWKIAAAVVLALAITLVVTLTGLAPSSVGAVVGGTLLLVSFVISLVVDVRK